ncbi:FKBP-type peptidyl-prolyl cis-trans isomerase [Litorivivens sp.]|uniref:FKBP-type peptidyl-prolyl cis-trans isomerase n=1 Tax=Litorivivens sp. TaxID=2020868 RepID=UPI0035658DA9
MTIDTQSRITLHFELAMEDGAVVDSTFERTPATFTYGDGSLLPGVEKKLLGMCAGEKKDFVLNPEDAFGQPNPANIQHFKRDQFGADMELAEGVVISFADAQRAELPGVVQSISDDEVVVNFNHPLAGRTLRFTAEILKVEAVSS